MKNKIFIIIHFSEIGKCFKELDNSPDCRVVILTGAGKAFCSGLDLQHAMSFAPSVAEHDDIARKARVYERKIKEYQDAFLSLEQVSFIKILQYTFDGFIRTESTYSVESQLSLRYMDYA